jgi:hypothetical protein
LPKYCLLVFGPQAKARVWLVLDGRDLYLDRNGNADLTEPGERIQGKTNERWLDFPVGTIQEANGVSRELSLRLRDFDFATGKTTGLMIVQPGKGNRFAGFDEASPLQLAHRPQQAPIIHVGGPLAVQWYGELPALIAGREAELNIAIGTPGLGKGSFCAIQCCTVLDCKVSPVAEIEFPARNAKETAPRVRVPIADD